MTLQQLIYVVTVADETSMNRAAQRLYLAQSSLSAGIHSLEEELGFSLFRRSNRGVVPTPEGEEFLAYARQIVSQYRLTEERFILKRQVKKQFSVSTQHYTSRSRPSSSWPVSSGRMSTPSAFTNAAPPKFWKTCAAAKARWVCSIWTTSTGRYWKSCWRT